MPPVAEPPAAPKEPLLAKQNDDHYHIFHADAHVLDGKLERPIEQRIEQQVPVHIKDRRGGHVTRISEDFSVEGFISYKRGLTRVSGSRSSKPLLGQKELGWTTLSTSILEGLNVFEVITVDRVVSQVSTDHAYENGHVPFVTFLGTQFHNLQVSGFVATPILDLGVVAQATKDQPPNILNSSFLGAVRAQNKTIADNSTLPPDVRKRYADSLTNVNELIGLKEDERKLKETTILFSLVKKIEIPQVPHINGYPIPGLEVIGNVLRIPEFGAVALGEVELKIEAVKEREPYESPLNGSAGARNASLSYSFEVTMLRMKLGCVGQGTVNAGTAKTNGSGRP